MHYVILPWFKMICTWYDDLFNATDEYWAWKFQFILFKFDFFCFRIKRDIDQILKELLPTNDGHDILFVIKMVKISGCLCFLTFKLVWSNFVIYNHCFLNLIF